MAARSHAALIDRAAQSACMKAQSCFASKQCLGMVCPNRMLSVLLHPLRNGLLLHRILQARTPLSSGERDHRTKPCLITNPTPLQDGQFMKGRRHRKISTSPADLKKTCTGGRYTPSRCRQDRRQLGSLRYDGDMHPGNGSTAQADSRITAASSTTSIRPSNPRHYGPIMGSNTH